MQNVFSTIMSTLFWNMNGVGNKFKKIDVTNIFKNGRYDVIAITETHFNIRIKCPNDYHFIGKSKNVSKNKPRGGVAVYQKKDSIFVLDVISEDYPDCVILQVRNTNIILITLYLPPIDSKFYDTSYFDSLILFYFWRSQLTCKYSYVST